MVRSTQTALKHLIRIRVIRRVHAQKVQVLARQRAAIPLRQQRVLRANSTLLLRIVQVRQILQTRQVQVGKLILGAV